ncbi:hypothetical protein Tco_1130646 [Tanacetum coccineum]
MRRLWLRFDDLKGSSRSLSRVYNGVRERDRGGAAGRAVERGRGAKGLTSPEQTATGKGISNPLMAVMVCQKPYGIQLTTVLRVNTPGSDENRLKLYDLMYKIVKVADTMD